MATNASPGHDADPSKAQRRDRGRSTRKGAHTDRRTDDSNNPTGDSRDGPTTAEGAFLLWLHPRTPIRGDVIRRKWAYFHQTDSPRDDPAPTWDGDHGLGRWSK